MCNVAEHATDAGEILPRHTAGKHSGECIRRHSGRGRSDSCTDLQAGPQTRQTSYLKLTCRG